MKKIILILLLIFFNVSIFAGASRDFEAGDTEYFQIQSAVVTALPITMAFYFKPESTAKHSCIGVIYSADRNNSWISGGPEATTYVYVNIRGTGGTNYATSSNQLTTGTWGAICCELESATSRYTWLNGTKGTQGTYSIALNTVDVSELGVLSRSSGYTYGDGLMAHAAYWSADLSDMQINEFNLGIPPIYISTNNCKAYYPLQEASGNAVDKSGNGYTMTQTDGTIDVSQDGPPKIFIPMSGQ